jgi:hypothetical protein
MNHQKSIRESAAVVVAAVVVASMFILRDEKEDVSSFLVCKTFFYIFQQFRVSSKTIKSVLIASAKILQIGHFHNLVTF